MIWNSKEMHKQRWICAESRDELMSEFLRTDAVGHGTEVEAIRIGRQRFGGNFYIARVSPTSALKTFWSCRDSAILGMRSTAKGVSKDCSDVDADLLRENSDRMISEWCLNQASKRAMDAGLWFNFESIREVELIGENRTGVSADSANQACADGSNPFRVEVILANEKEDEGSTKPIFFYELKYYMFSNFSSFQVEFDGELWPTSEHCYQAMKFARADIKKLIRKETSAHAAARTARGLKHLYVEDWEHKKFDVMLSICRAKCFQHIYIQKKLLQTGDREIVEASPVDSYWGHGPDGEGLNNLGKVWGIIRDQLKRTKYWGK